VAGRLQVSEKATVQLLKSNATMFACSLLWYFNVNVNYQCFYLNFTVILLHIVFKLNHFAVIYMVNNVIHTIQ